MKFDIFCVFIMGVLLGVIIGGNFVVVVNIIMGDELVVLDSMFVIKEVLFELLGGGLV